MKPLAVFSVGLLLLAGASIVSAGELVVDIPFDASGLQIDQLGIYTRVVSPGMSLIEHEGWPRLPVLRAKVALPTACRATRVEVLDAEYESVRGLFDILPAGPLVPFSVEADVRPVDPDPHIYNSDEFFPYQICELSSSGVIWGIPLAYLDVSAVRWNPVSRELQVLSSVSVQVTFEYDPDLLLVNRRLQSSELRAQQLVSKMVVNPEGVSPSGAEFVSARDLAYGQYVIITHPDYETAAQTLADWKTAKGIPANVYTTDWVSSQYSCWDLQQEMRAFLTDCRDEGADFVLIYGDDDRIAARDAYMTAYSYTENAPCDLYFADINDTAPGPTGGIPTATTSGARRRTMSTGIRISGSAGRASTPPRRQSSSSTRSSSTSRSPPRTTSRRPPSRSESGTRPECSGTAPTTRAAPRRRSSRATFRAPHGKRRSATSLPAITSPP